MSRVPVTDCADFLFTVCYIYERSESEKPEFYKDRRFRVGVLTKIQDKKFFVKLLQHRQKEKQDWLDPATSILFADLALGHVSQQYLQTHDLFEAKIRGIKFISATESATESTTKH